MSAAAADDSAAARASRSSSYPRRVSSTDSDASESPPTGSPSPAAPPRADSNSPSTFLSRAASDVASLSAATLPALLHALHDGSCRVGALHGLSLSSSSLLLGAAADLAGHVAAIEN